MSKPRSEGPPGPRGPQAQYIGCSACSGCLGPKGPRVLGAPDIPVHEDALGAGLAQQGGVLLHLLLVAGAPTLAAVGGVGHDGPLVQNHDPGKVLKGPRVDWTGEGEEGGGGGGEEERERNCIKVS